MKIITSTHCCCSLISTTWVQPAPSAISETSGRKISNN